MAGVNIPSGAFKVNGVDIKSTLRPKQSTGLTYNPANPFLFDNDYQYNNYTVSANITPTYSLTGAIALNGVSITFVGDGTHTVDFVNFVESDLSGTFDITNGAENKVIFYYDGIDVIYNITSNTKIASSTVTGLLSNTDWTTFNNKQAALVSGTNIKTINSTSVLGSGDIAVQPTLVSGTNIKTINSTSLLGSGNITISGGTSLAYNTYYIANNGNDTTGDGSLASPWATLGKAWTVVAAGDIVYVRGGVYNFTSISGDRAIELMGKSGESGKTIKLWNYPGELPIFDCTNVAPTNYKAICYVEGSYLHFKGLRFKSLQQYNSGVGWNGNYGFVGYNLSYCTIENCEFDHIGGAGFQIWGTSASNNLILNCDSHHNADPYSSDAWSNANGFNITPSGGNNNTFRGCRAWFNSDDGFDLYGYNGTVYFENCWAFWNGFIPEEGNPVNFTGVGDGYGFKLGNSSDHAPTVVKTFLYNCVSVHNYTIGFAQNGATHAHSIKNCIAYNNPTHPYHTAVDDGGTPFVNIYQNNWYYGGTLAINSAATNTYNNWNLSITIAPSTDFLSTDENYLLTERNKLNNELPFIPFLYPTSTSQVLNVGTNLGFRYYGSAPDLGAFERYPQTIYDTRLKTINNTPLVGEGNITISSGVTPTDNILAWDGTNKWYAPYSSKQTSMSFYTGTTAPTLTTRLNLDANLYTTGLNVTNNISAARGLFVSSSNHGVYGVHSSTTEGVFAGVYANSYLQYGYGLLVDNGTQTPSAIGTKPMVFINRNYTIGTSANLTNDLISIVDNPTTSGTISGKVLSATIGTTERISLNPRIVNSGTNKAYILDTHNTLSGTTELLSIQNNTVERFRVTPSNTALPAGTSSTFVTVGGVLKDFYTDISTSGTSETDLYSYNIPANTMGSNGDKISAKFFVTTTDDNQGIKPAKVYLAGSQLSTISQNMAPGSNYAIEVEIIRVTSNTSRCFIKIGSVSFQEYLSYNGSSADWASDNILKVTVTCPTGSATAKFGTIEYKPAAIN